MNDEELLQQQVVMSTSNSQVGQTVWVYRGSMWAYVSVPRRQLRVSHRGNSDTNARTDPNDPPAAVVHERPGHARGSCVRYHATTPSILQHIPQPNTDILDYTLTRTLL
jgi:hypothetical protein